MDTKEVSIGDAICLGLDERPAVKDPPRMDLEDKPSDESSRKQNKNYRIGEICEFRGKDHKIYRMSDGSEQAVFYPAPIHVFDEETQTYEAVEHTLKEEEDGRYFICGKNNFTARFSREDNSDELFSIARGACRVTVSARKNRNNRNKGIVPVLRKGERAGGFADILSYANAEPGADYEYSVEGSGVKENIVVKEKADVYRYPFTLHCENVVAQFLEEKSQISFLSEETGEEVFYIPAPFMSDANGVLSTAVTYEMKKMDNGVVHLTVTADSDFMNAEGRAFPVVIDPQIHLSGISAMTTYSWQDGYMYSAAAHEVGTTGNGDGPCNGKRMYIHFNMPTLPRNPRIKKAELIFTQLSSSTGISDIPKFGLYTVTSGISLGDCSPMESSELIDCAKMNFSANGGITYTFDVTTLIDRISGNSRYYPQDLVLKTIDKDAPVNVGITLFGSSYLANEEYAPKFVITYETSYGVNTS